MEIGVIILCLILSAFFSDGNCIISSNKIYLEIEKKQDNFLLKFLLIPKSHQNS
jgi:Mg2+/Co2+ transporter CorB